MKTTTNVQKSVTVPTMVSVTDFRGNAKAILASVVDGDVFVHRHSTLIGVIVSPQRYLELHGQD